MRSRISFLMLVLSLIPSALFAQTDAAKSQTNAIIIVSPKDASIQETLAAREIRRYVYLRTGKLLPISL